MADATPTRSGQVNLSGSTTAMFLKVYGGEILARFRNQTKFLDKNVVRTIKSGQSATFPSIGAATAAYHTPGAELTGNTIAHAETVITLDDLLVAHTYVPKIDELKNHFDVRSTYAVELADVLSQTYDSNVAQLIIKAASTAHPISSITLPTRSFIDANYRVDGEALAAGIYKGVQTLDEMNAPEMDRYAAILPAQYYLLAQTTKVINKDWGGAGVYADGTVLKVGGATLVKTNKLPQTNVTTGPTAYQVNATNVAAVVWQKRAVGTLKLLDLSTEVFWDPRRRATLMVAEYAMGHGVLRPDAATVLKVA